MKIFEIQADYRRLFDELEIDEETGELIGGLDKLQELEALEGEWADKLEAMALYTKELAKLAEDIKEECDTLTKRRKSLENTVDFWKQTMITAMDGMGRNSFETARAKLSFRNSKAVRIIAEDKLLPKFITIKETTTPNKTAIKAAIESGENVEGAELCINRNLQIK